MDPSLSMGQFGGMPGGGSLGGSPTPDMSLGGGSGALSSGASGSLGGGQSGPVI